jgi:hypothetical protein
MIDTMVWPLLINPGAGEDGEGPGTLISGGDVNIGNDLNVVGNITSNAYSSSQIKIGATLGSTILTDGGLELWTSDTDLTN